MTQKTRRGKQLKPQRIRKGDREILDSWVRRPTSAQRFAFRARIVIMSEEGKSVTEVAKELGSTRMTVGKWRERYRKEGLGGLHDEPRPGRPRTVVDNKLDEIMAKTLETKPQNRTQWSTRTLASECGVSHSSVHRVWRAFGLQSHTESTFKLSTDPYFVDKVQDIVGLYLSPPQNAIVLCVDEKSQIQALDRTQPLLPKGLGYAESRTHDYERHGTTNLFAAFNTLTGEVIARCHAYHRHQEFLKFLKDVKDQLADDQEVHLVMDNYGTHKAPKVNAWLARQKKWHIHFTPTSASWLNQVERFFAKITSDSIRRGTFPSVASLERAIHQYIDNHNENPKPFVWKATAEEIFAKLERLCKRINNTGH